MSNEEGVLSRTRLLLGTEAIESIRQKRIIIFGVGGVGSWCAEGLVRSGIRHLTLVDFDCVCESNINRQLMATTDTVGEIKVDALKAHLMLINPSADITAVRQRFTADTLADFRLSDFDYIIDAIDSLDDKALLISEACKTKAKLFSSMGAARKLDPTKIQVAEFWKVRGCPLAKALRNRFKRNGVRPARKFSCVFSEEVLSNRGAADEERANGSLVHITAIFGFTISGLILKHIADQCDNHPCEHHSEQ